MATINLINPDADVATYNVRRNDELSTRYLYLLSDDAVPALVVGLEHAKGEVGYRLRLDLTRRYYEMERDASWKEWPSFNFARQEAYKILLKLKDKDQLFD